MTHCIRLTQDCLASIPHMTFQEIVSLSTLTEYQQVRLYIVEHHVPNLKRIRDVRSLLSSVETQEVYLILLLNIIANICHIGEGIKKIAEEKELVEFVCRCFGVCNRNFHLQKKLFQILHLITCEIQANPASKWTRYLTNSSYFLGNNIINIMANCLNERSPLTEIIITLETLSGLEMPDATSVLEHLFKIDDLMSALFKWSSVAFVKKEIDRDDIPNISDNQWFIIDKWLTVMIAITNLNSFKRTYENKTDHVDHVIMIDILNIIHYLYNSNLYHAAESLISPEKNQLFLPIQCAVAAFDKSITLLLRFSRDKTMPQNAIIMHDILENFSKIVEHQPILNNPIPDFLGLLTNIKYIEQYLLQSMTHWSCKTIVEMFHLCNYVIDNLRNSLNLPRNMSKKMSFVETECTYLFNSYYD